MVEELTTNLSKKIKKTNLSNKLTQKKTTTKVCKSNKYECNKNNGRQHKYCCSISTTIQTTTKKVPIPIFVNGRVSPIDYVTRELALLVILSEKNHTAVFLETKEAKFTSKNIVSL